MRELAHTDENRYVLVHELFADCIHFSCVKWIRGRKSDPFYTMDNYIQTDGMRIAWDAQKKRELERAYAFCSGVLNTPLTLDEFSKVWYSEKKTDKTGKNHLANMCMSIFQSRKANAGKGFEDAIYTKHKEVGIEIIHQAWVDKDGNIYKKNPKIISVHKVDGLIPTTANRTNTRDMYILSIKTTSRERYRQGIDLIGKCKGYIFLTRETPDNKKIQSILGYGMILVYPHAGTTDTIWSYESYFEKIKQLICNNPSE